MADLSLSLGILRECLHYDPDTGVFTRKVATNGPSGRVGAICGYPDKKGHIYICFRGSRYAAHRLAWFYIHGRWPVDLIDHINGQTGDNRIANLREADVVLNGQNQRRGRRGSSTGVLGVCVQKNRFRAQINIDGKNTYLGLYKTAEEASRVYLAAKRVHHAGCTI